jgi:hypothetical protein
MTNTPNQSQSARLRRPGGGRKPFPEGTARTERIVCYVTPSDAQRIRRHSGEWVANTLTGATGGECLVIRVTPTVAAWIEMQGGSKAAAEILTKACLFSDHVMRGADGGGGPKE